VKEKDLLKKTGKKVAYITFPPTSNTLERDASFLVEKYIIKPRS
jgi:hypothetical protein